MSYVWSQNAKPQIRFVKVSIFEPKQQFSNVKQKFYEYSQWDNFSKEVDMKRFKKELVADLGEYVDFRKMVETARNEEN